MNNSHQEQVQLQEAANKHIKLLARKTRKFSPALRQTLINRGWFPKKEGLDVILREWWQNKDELRKLLRKHPQWSEDDQAIIIIKKEEIKYTTAQQLDVLSHFLSSFGHDILQSKIALRKVVNERMVDKNGQITKEGLEVLVDGNVATDKNRVGQRLATIMTQWIDRYIVEHQLLDFRKNGTFAHRESEFYTSLKTKTVTSKYILSIHPSDYINMAYSHIGDLASSCHNTTRAEKGSYCNGTLSYLMDGSAMVFYTVGDKEDNIHEGLRITRQMFFYQNKLLLQSRFYPNCSKTPGVMKRYRNTVQDIISECHSSHDRWISLVRTHDDIESWVITDPDSGHYADYLCDPSDNEACQGINISHTGIYVNTDRNIAIGHQPLCIICGEKFDRTRPSLYCSHCLETREKYEFVRGDTIQVGDFKLHRIRALRSFYGVKAGDLGGYIWKEDNLSHRGDCWVGGRAAVWGDGKVQDDARVIDNAIVCDGAVISDKAVVYGRAHVYGIAQVKHDANVGGRALVYGDALINQDRIVKGYTIISGFEKKFEFTDVTKDIMINHRQVIVQQIRALRDVNGEVKQGDIGGWLCSELNLSQDCNCSWVHDNAVVCGCAQVYDNAQIRDNAQIIGSARIYNYATVSQNAIVGDSVKVYDQAKISGTACLRGTAEIYDQAHITGATRVVDCAVIGGRIILDESCVSGSVQLRGTMTFHNVHIYSCNEQGSVTIEQH
jgi:carbonic anhydrase/acetyltransferase-like protein (isoleucine patch superfamily)